ncbi:MAG: putative manganese-dependent inorganic diphosphatase [Verrucomicrobiota bacterium]|nr:putative manganese-dependent inorganic diphosphatase [Verrucomicrobiota bacterium]
MDIPTYIVGHKNPDADAICSAIAYAAYKTSRGLTNHVAARCGNSNARIDAILERFQVPLPVFMGDVTPRVHDIMVSHPHTVKISSTCAQALEIIDRYNIRVLPVVRDDNTLEGTVSIFQLGEYFIPKPKAPRQMRHVRTSINDIVGSLNATALSAFNPDSLEDLYVRIGAMDIRSFGKFANEEATLASHSIIVVGDRWDIQQKSIQARVRVLVITGGLEVDAEIIDLAKEKGVSLLSSPHDSATTSWIIRSATRVGSLINRSFVHFAQDEKLSVVKRRIIGNNAQAYMVTDENNKLLGLFTNGDLLKPVGTRLILVDHNELTQAVTGAEQVNIVEIIDHHRLGNPPTQQPILFVNEPVGSTCTIVGGLFHRDGITPSAQIAGILMSGIISDTLNLQSPTSTEKDALLLPWLEKLAGISSSELSQLIFSSGSVILASKPDAVIRSDMKVYSEGEIRYSVSQIEELGFNNFHNNVNALLAALESIREKENLFFSSLLVTDINTQNSLLVMAGDSELISQISYPAVIKESVFDVPGIVSRKKQLIPYLTSLLKSIGIEAKN